MSHFLKLKNSHKHTLAHTYSVRIINVSLLPPHFVSGTGMNHSLSALTWASDSMLLPVDLAFRVLVMLSGRSPNLQDKMTEFE